MKLICAQAHLDQLLHEADSYISAELGDRTKV